MKLGFWTPLPHVLQSEPAIDAAVTAASTRGPSENDTYFDFAKKAVCQAEAYGFDITLIAERWNGPDHAAWVLASALAAVTSRIGLMVAVHPGILPPQSVAKMVTTLDRISCGRAAVNIVNGWWPEEMNIYGNGAWLEDPAQRYQRMDEYVAVLKAMWSEGVPVVDGGYYKLDGVPLALKPVSVPNPPLFAASRSEPGKNTIARYCDCWFAEYDTDFRQYSDNIARIEADCRAMQDRAAGFGRRLEFGVSAHVICEPTMDEAIRKAEELEAFGKHNRVALTAAKSLGAGLVGTPDLIVERIEDYRRAGVDLLMLRFHPMLEGLEIFAREIMPRLRQA